jgi:hypothetical protein
MFGIKFDDITEEHIQSLIDMNVQEDSSVEYKREYPDMAEKGKHEFLADVSALANHHGGYIFYGIEEVDGQPVSINPLPINPDKDCLRLQDIVINNLEPKLSGCHVRAVDINGKGYVVVVNVPKSWSKPHRVKTNNHFYIRDGARKRPLEMPEIKMAFINSDQPKKRLTEFRAERISKVISEETPIKIADGIVQMLHVIPTTALLNDLSVDVLKLIDFGRVPVMSQNLGLSFKINVDGMVVHRALTERGSGAYTQIFRNGFIEAVRVFPSTNPDTGRLTVPSTLYEREIIDFIKQLKVILGELGLAGSFVLLYSLLNALKGELGVSNTFFLDEGQGIFDRSQILLPDLLIENITLDEGKALMPIFDLVWNAAGFRESRNYDRTTGIWCGS